MLACAVSIVAGQAHQPATVVALVGARVYADPAAVPVDDAVVVVTGPRITAVGPRKDVPVPPGATTIDATGLVVLAGFQNSHVHFTDDARWGGAASRPAAALEASLREMVTRYGYTTVVDLASFPDNTKALRRRVDSGEIDGPRILTAGAPLYPPDGVPYYVRDTLPAEVVATLPQPATPAAAAQIVRAQLAGGTDAVKLFTGAWVTRGRVLPMPADIAAAADGRGAGGGPSGVCAPVEPGGAGGRPRRRRERAGARGRGHARHDGEPLRADDHPGHGDGPDPASLRRARAMGHR